MEWETLLRTLKHVKHLCDVGTQGEVSLTGIGEAILHPQFVDALWLTRQTIGWDRPLVMSTNGTHVTDEIVAQLNAARVQVFVSLHRSEVAGPAISKLKAAGVDMGTNMAFVDSALNWAGQVEWHVSAPVTTCKYLSDGWAVVRQDGSINTCCMDAHGKHPIGSVWDELGSLKTRPTSLCSTCHLKVPEHLREAA
jgi:hypothetical protein